MAGAPAAASTGQIFRFPVMSGTVISGYFDHNPQAGRVTFYNGRQNISQAYGFYFSCSNPSMYDFVGCEDPVGGEAACANNRELWYDGHHGIDYEFSPNWHTGASCDPNRFTGLTRQVYAPAAGRVMFAGTDASRPGNGWHIRIRHDLNGNGSYNDDNFRSNFLHFTPNSLAVQTNDPVVEGQYLGLGGTTGYSSSPHLHFEVQRSSDNFQTTVWPVDPYGWYGREPDPWPYQNQRLWNVAMPFQVLLPAAANDQLTGCPGCGELAGNGGFESGRTVWTEIGHNIITNRSDQYLTVTPYAGDWLAWLGGRNSASDTVYLNFTVPTGVGSIVLKYRVRMGTQESGGVYDLLYARLRRTNGEMVNELDSINNTFTPVNQWVLREITIPNGSAYAGQTLRLSFEGTTDTSLVTNFYLDEISLTASP
jgi:murein DD-endopeptidase MepM/ murein hydrolase activator NlpD